jgi:hypothetical protein
VDLFLAERDVPWRAVYDEYIRPLSELCRALLSPWPGSGWRGDDTWIHSFNGTSQARGLCMERFLWSREPYFIAFDTCHHKRWVSLTRQLSCTY